MAQGYFRWRQTRGTVLGLMVGWAVLSGCRPTGRRALTEGDRLLQAGKMTEAIPLLERAAADLQTDGAAWNYLGRAYHESGRVTDARKAYLRALQADRNLFEAHFNLGQLALESGAWRDAEAGFRTWLGAGQGTAAPASVATAWRGLGIAQLRQGNLNDAERSFGSALRVDDKDAESWNAVGLIRQQRRQYRDAFNTFAHAARLNPQFAAPRLNAAVVAHQYLNDRRAALEYYRAYLSLNPPDAAAITQLIAQLEPRVGAVTTPVASPVEPTNAITGTPAVVPAPTSRTTVSGTNNPPAIVRTPNRTAVPATTAAAPTTASATKPVTAAPKEPVMAPTTLPDRKAAAPELSGPTSVSPPTQPDVAVTAPVKATTVTAPDTPRTTRAPERIESPVAAPVTPPTTAPIVNIPSPALTTPVDTAPKPSPPAAITPPVEIVQVPERPTIRPAQEPVTTPTPTIPPPTEAIAPVSNPNSTPALPAAAEDPSPNIATGQAPAATTEAEGTNPDANKRSLWAKANPVNWFKRDHPTAPAPNSSKRITPLEFPPYDPTATAPAPAPVAAPVVTPPPVRKTRPREIATLSPSRPTEAPATPSVAPAVPTPVVVPKPVFEPYRRQVTAAPSPGNHAAAEKEFESALAAHRNNDLAAATTGYQQAIALDPAYFEAQYNLSLAAVAQNNLSVALRSAETATALRPTDVAARYQFAVVLQRSRHPVEAAAEMEEIARLQQTNSASHLAAATLYANDLQEPDRARPHYEKVLALEPAHPQAASIRRWLAGNPAR